MGYIKIAPKKYKNQRFSPLKNTKHKNTNMLQENTKSPHNNQNLCFRRIFVFLGGFLYFLGGKMLGHFLGLFCHFSFLGLLLLFFREIFNIILF